MDVCASCIPGSLAILQNYIYLVALHLSISCSTQLAIMPALGFYHPKKASPVLQGDYQVAGNTVLLLENQEPELLGAENRQRQRPEIPAEQELDRHSSDKC